MQPVMQALPACKLYSVKKKKNQGKRKKKKRERGKKKTQPTLLLKIDAWHMSASRALTFYIPALFHRVSGDYSILQPHFLAVN